MKALILFTLIATSVQAFAADVSCLIKDLHSVPNEEKVLLDQEVNTEFVSDVKSVKTKCTNLNRYKLSSWSQAKTRGLKVESDLKLTCESKKGKGKKECKKQLKAISLNNDNLRMLFEEYETNLQLCQQEESSPNVQTGLTETKTNIVMKSLFTLKENRHEKSYNLVSMDSEKKEFKLNLVDPTTGIFDVAQKGEFDLHITCEFVALPSDRAPASVDTSVKEHNPIPASPEQEQLRAIEQE